MMNSKNYFIQSNNLEKRHIMMQDNFIGVIQNMD